MMRIRIETDNRLDDTEIIIKCKEITPEIEHLHKIVLNVSKTVTIVVYKDNNEFYLNLNQILFFEIEGLKVLAHTKDDFFTISKRLYELEALLPLQFVRISKSTIVNVNHIYSIERNITASSLILLNNSHKQVYASRSYYKDLKKRLEFRTGVDRL